MSQYNLDTLRHSTAHLMAQAIQELYPTETVKLGIGPTIENGFYYDVDLATRILDEDLKGIEKKMKEIIKRADVITRFEVSREEALKVFAERGQEYKIELIHDLADSEVISYYTQGDHFIDLCKGPHVETTKELNFNFKLLHTAGAYWRGNEKRPMLQRIYAACFETKEELKEHLAFLAEAKKRDHRKLGKELNLFLFDSAAPGSPFFEPKGTIVYNELVSFMRRIYDKFDYDEVITPQVLDVNLWKTSGHYDNYAEDMFFTADDHREMAVKPMNCPCHMLMFKHKQYSYRDLPLRFADFGRLHRNERSGTLSGLTRVRTFCQDDAHVFIDKNEIQEEIIKLLSMFDICYDHFGFKNIKVGLSTRPEKKVGDDATWDMAETALKSALDKSEYDYHINEGDGAFYGPKIDIQISDALGRYFQLGTLQLDFQLPERFDLKFKSKEGTEERPVVIHRALLGSLERFFGVYLEHCAGVFPFWLAPEQVIIVPVNNELHLDYANEILSLLKQNGIRSKIDHSNETLGKKTRTIQKAKVPYMVIVGDKEKESQSISIRAYGSRDTNEMTQLQLTQLVCDLNQEKTPKKLRDL
ncbi:MAG: threonine--tRNA ligase [Halobacteriovoraceae bacterium]|jgi:threonyl-tRNA synthetase|nr:threonine--tRNA ligase [Halobacteriovoraceae bacterium]